MFWQWNDCWPVTSWSAIDYYGRKKALYYEVKRSFSDSVLSIVKKQDGFLAGVISGVVSDDTLASSIHLVPFDPDGTFKTYRISIPQSGKFTLLPFSKFIRPDLDSATLFKNYFIKYSTHGKDRATTTSTFLMTDPKYVNLPKPDIHIETAPFGNALQLTTDKFAYGVYINVPDGVELDDNYFNLVPDEVKFVKFRSAMPFEKFINSITVKSLVDTYKK